MRTKVRETSMAAYHLAVKSGMVSAMQKKVLHVIATNSDVGVTDRNIMRTLHVGINQITGRRHELVEKGLVCEAGFVVDGESGIRVHKWRVNMEYKQDE